MQKFSIPGIVKGLIMDVDNTLYRNEGYIRSQITLLTQKFADFLDISFAEAEEKIERYKRVYARENNGKRPSIGNTFLSFGISIETSVAWRNELLSPEEFLREDKILRKTLERLSGKFHIKAVTNNPAEIGRRTLRTLGIEEFFSGIVGLDTSGVSKPHRKPFEMGVADTGIPLSRWVSVGDRFEVDLEIPISMGMGGILIESMADVYALPGILEKSDGPY